jgi:hypothetical protein
LPSPFFAGLEHGQHAFGHRVAAGGIGRAEHHRDEAEDLPDQTGGVEQRMQCADHTMPWTKLEPDISGVCRIDRHPRDHFVAGERGEHEDVQRDQPAHRKQGIHFRPLRLQQRGGRLVDDCAVVGQQVPATTSSLRSAPARRP